VLDRTRARGIGARLYLPTIAVAGFAAWLSWPACPPRPTVDRTVDEPVENPRPRGITVRGVWIDMWIRKILEIVSGNLLCWPSGERRNLLSPETGTGRGRLRQRRKNRETGFSGGFPALVIG
jgi:hypothetical protein